MVLLAKISLPLVFVLDISGKAILALLGQSGDAGEKVSEEEIHNLVLEAESAGVLEELVELRREVRELRERLDRLEGNG